MARFGRSRKKTPFDWDGSKVWLARHGEYVDSTGSLTGPGKQHARRTASFLLQAGFRQPGLIITSTEKRAEETALIVAADIGVSEHVVIARSSDFTDISLHPAEYQTQYNARLKTIIEGALQEAAIPADSIDSIVLLGHEPLMRQHSLQQDGPADIPYGHVLAYNPAVADRPLPIL